MRNGGEPPDYCDRAHVRCGTLRWHIRKRRVIENISFSGSLLLTAGRAKPMKDNHKQKRLRS
ncbi:hypothetical protein BN135_3515 [Cronobacter muytjensii 530]